MILCTQSTAALHRKRPIRRFPLDWVSGEKGGRLEARLPTVPIFFKVNNGALQNASIWGNNLALTNNTSTVTAVNSGVDEQYQALIPGTNIYYMGQVLAGIIDVPNTSPPTSPPLGGYAVETNSAHQIFTAFPGFVPMAEAMATNAVGGAQYTLADDQTPAVSPVTLVEDFQIVYFPTTGDTFVSAAFVTFTFGNGNNLIVAGDGTGLNQVGVNNLLGASALSGTDTFGATTITWATSGTTFLATATTVFPTGLPSTTGANPPTGVTWNVAYTATLAVGYGGGPIGTSTNDLAELTTHTDTYFV